MNTKIGSVSVAFLRCFAISFLVQLGFIRCGSADAAFKDEYIIFDKLTPCTPPPPPLI